MINSSQLDERIELFSPAGMTDDGYTTAPSGWVSEGKVWTKYMPGTVREVFEAQGREGEMPAVFEVRRSAMTALVNDTWKLVHRGMSYDVKGATRLDRSGIRIVAVGTDEAVPEA